MKKSISLLLCVLLLASLAAEAFAGAAWEQPFETRGFTLRFAGGQPAKTGVLYCEDGSELGVNIACVYVYYIALPEARFQELLTKERSEAEDDELFSAVCSLATIYTVGGGRDFSAVSDLYAAYGFERDSALAREVGRAGDYRFYSYDESASAAALTGEYAEDFAAVKAALSEALDAADYYEPAAPYSDMVGKTVRFETRDLDGAAVDSEALFASHALTMVNVWATWCGPCVGELGELDALNRLAAELDCAVVGLLLDGDEAGAPEEARRLLAENGATYTVVLPPEDVDALFPLDAIPTSYFVDRSGTIVCPPIIGARVDVYEQRFRELLAGAVPTATANSAGAYRVFVVDESGAPVEGVTVQLCSGELCHVVKTDAAGLAVFAAEQGDYTAYILKAPASFAADDAEYPMLASYSDLTITLRSAG